MATASKILKQRQWANSKGTISGMDEGVIIQHSSQYLAVKERRIQIKCQELRPCVKNQGLMKTGERA